MVIEGGLSDDPDGRRIADTARVMRPELPVLFITAGTGGGFEEAVGAGLAVVGKPLSLNAFARKVSSMIERVPGAVFA